MAQTSSPLFLLLALTACAVGCGTEAPRTGESASESGISDSAALTDSGSGTGSTSSPPADSESASESTGDDDTDGGPPGPQECAGVSAEPEITLLPADIIFVVDNSGSMDFEAGEVQSKLNEFSELIDDADIDARVILISSYPDAENGICIDPPLGAPAGCADNANADSNPPLFTHVDEKVESHDAWDIVLASYPAWSPVIRENASLHLVVVTDDDNDTSLEEFDAGFRALSPNFATYFHHSVVCHSDCESAAAIGTDYINLSMQTMGVAADLCDQDFESVFEALTTAIIGGNALACEFAIPEPPMGATLDPDFVNVELDDGMGGVTQIVRVDSAALCGGMDGWYYDDPADPQMIILCPETCEGVQGQVGGSIGIQFGCETVVPG